MNYVSSKILLKLILWNILINSSIQKPSFRNRSAFSSERNVIIAVLQICWLSERLSCNVLKTFWKSHDFRLFNLKRTLFFSSPIEIRDDDKISRILLQSELIALPTRFVSSIVLFKMRKVCEEKKSSVWNLMIYWAVIQPNPSSLLGNSSLAVILKSCSNLWNLRVPRITVTFSDPMFRHWRSAIEVTVTFVLG